MKINKKNTKSNNSCFRTEYSIAKRRKIIEKREIAEKKEKCIREKDILSGARSLIIELLETHPQIDETNGLNYYLSGSFATLLFAQAEKFEIIDEQQIPKIVTISEKIISKRAKKQFNKCTKRIRDIDFISLKKEEINNQRKAVKREWKIEPKNLSENAKKCLKLKEEQSHLRFDSLESNLPHKIARIEIDGKNVYIAEPIIIFSHKAVSLAKLSATEEEVNELVDSLDNMLKGIKCIYDYEKLLAITHEIMFNSFDLENSSPFCYDSKLSSELLKYYNDVISQDKDFKYLNQLNNGNEYTISILHILHQYKSPKRKKAIISFLNRNWGKIDNKVITKSSQKNRELIAKFLTSNPPLLYKFKEKIKVKNLTEKRLLREIKIHDWAVEKYGDKIDNKEKMEMIPMRSDILTILSCLDKDNFEKEMRDVEELLDFGVNQSNTLKIIKSSFASGSEKRELLMDVIKTARAFLSDNSFNNFFSRLSDIIVSSDKEKYRLEKIIHITDILYDNLAYETGLRLENRFKKLKQKNQNAR